MRWPQVLPSALALPSGPAADTSRCQRYRPLPCRADTGGVGEAIENPIGLLPVRQLLQERAHVGGAAILMIEIVGVLPQVERQQRGVAAHHGRGGIAGGYDLEAAGTPHQP